MGIGCGEHARKQGWSGQRASGVVDSDEKRGGGSKGLKAVENRGAALCSTWNDMLEFGVGCGELCEFLNALR